MQNTTKQEMLMALNGISYSDWLEIKFQIDGYFRRELEAYEKKLKLDSNQAKNY